MNQAAAMSKQSTVGNLNQVLHTARKRLDSGRLKEAEDSLRQVLQVEPDNYEALNLMGVVAHRSRLYPQAAELISRALEQQPNYPQALNNLGSVMIAMGKAEQAEKLFEMALKYKPGYPEAMSNLGALWNTMERHEEAEQMLRKALKKMPKSIEARHSLGNALQGKGKLEEALSEYQRGIRLAPSHAACAASAGQVKMLLGSHREAVTLYEHALNKDPLCVPALGGLAAAKKISSDGRELKLFRKAGRMIDRMSFKDRVDFQFAYGKVHQDLGEYEEAFECFEEANAGRRQLRPYRRGLRLKMAEAIAATFNHALFERLGQSGHESERPIFILGMPRSGTTLTEQVMSSHPQVYGAGELTLFNTLVNGDLGVHVAKDLPAMVEGLDAQRLREIGEKYLSSVINDQPAAADYARFTDKLPGNFWNIGMIKLVFPNAKVIHVRRNPVDTCLSCFQVNFTSGHSYSNNLKDLGEYYGLYRKMMTHWRETLPGFMLEVDYEALVTEPEETTRRMVEFAGLEWSDACLDPTKNRRAVWTASHWQVRQAVHTGSVERWRRYESHLGPLLEALRANGVDVD